MSLASPSPAARSLAPIVAVAAGLQALLPLSTDIYLAGMTAMGRDFGVGVAGVQRTMMAFAIGLGLAHFLIGGLADHFGRRPVAVVGLAIYLLATVAGVVAPDLGTLVAARFVQGAAAATGPILMRAVMRDAVPPAEAPRYFSLVGTYAGVAPVAAPLLGAAAASFGGWRASLVVLFVYASLLLTAVIVLLPETLKPENRAPGIVGAPFTVIGRLLRARDFRIGAAAILCGYGALFTWLSTGAFLLGERLGFDSFATALVFGLGSVGFLAGNWLSLRLTRRVPPPRLMIAAGIFGALGMAAFLAAVSFWRPPVAVVIVMVQPFYMAFGMAQPIAIAVAMRPFASIAGQASALFGVGQQLGAALLSTAAVAAGAGLVTIGLMVLGMIGVALGGVALARPVDTPASSRPGTAP